MSPEKKIWIPFTVTGGVSTAQNAGINTLSGFTNALTRFKFSVSAAHAQTTSAISLSGISNDVFVWDLGDGTVVKSITAQHIYKYPGTYNVSLVVYNSAGQEFLSTQSTRLSVSNFLSDRLEYDSSDVANILNVPAGTKGQSLTPVQVNRYSSWQSYNPVSAVGYTLNLYASGSKSKKLNLLDYLVDKWGHVSHTWSFYQAITADNKDVDYIPVESVHTSTEPLYYIAETVRGAQTFTRVPSSYMTTTSAVSTVFVGTSGIGEFYYGDDTPKMEDDPVFIHAAVDTSRYPSQRQIIAGDTTQFFDLQFSEQTNLIIPVRVRFNSAQYILFTSCGIGTMPITNSKWQLNDIPFFIGFADSRDSVTENYPSISIYSPRIGDTPKQETYVTNLSVISGNNVDGASWTSTKLVSTNFFRTVDTQLPSILSGSFRGYFVPIETGDNLHLRGTINVNDPPNFNKDIIFNWVAVPETQQLFRHVTQQTYSISDTTGVIDISKPILQHTITYPKIGSHHTGYEIIPTAVSQTEYDNFSNSRTITYILGTNTDTLSAYNTYGVAVSSMSLSARPVEAGAAHDSGSTNPFDHVPSELIDIIAEYAVTPVASLNPTSISVDRYNNYWIGCSAAGIVMRFPQWEVYVDRMVSGPKLTDNIVYTNTLTGAAGMYVTRDDFGTLGTYTPGIVETDASSNVWVGNTNPLSGFILKIDGATGTALLSANLPQGLEITDMVCDNSNNIWVSTTNKYRRLQADSNTNWHYSTVVDTISAYKNGTKVVFCLSAQHVNPTGMFKTDQIVELSGFETYDDNNLFNGKYIIQSVNDHTLSQAGTTDGAYTAKVSVVPYTGRAIKTPSTANQRTVSAFVYPSDKIYKFDSTGTKIAEVSGFLNPQSIVLDGHGNPWVTHDTNTVTQISSGGDILRNIRIETTQFISDSAVGNSQLYFTLSANNPHLGGISFDTYHNLLVINSYENRLFKIGVHNYALSSTRVIGTISSPISSSTGYVYGKSTGVGDWTGFRWLNKYGNTAGVRTLSGDTTFTVYPSSGKYTVAKINENYDPAETLKSYRFQPLLEDYPVLFDTFLGSILGTLSSSPTDLGRVVYEKIANFTDNHSDIDTCNINALYSLCEQFDIRSDNYNFNYPGGLKRLMDLFSIKHKKLWGERGKFDRDFDRRGILNPGYGRNLGTELDVVTAVVVAGTPIVAHQLFDNIFLRINTAYVSGETVDPRYDPTVGMLSSYPLSAYSSNWGWGLQKDLAGTDVQKFYNFYEYVPNYRDIQLEGVIDWNNPYTNLVESNSGIAEWLEDGGIVDVALDYELRRGLGLFNTGLSASVSAVL